MVDTDTGAAAVDAVDLGAVGGATGAKIRWAVLLPALHRLERLRSRFAGRGLVGNAKEGTARRATVGRVRSAVWLYGMICFPEGRPSGGSVWPLRIVPLCASLVAWGAVGVGRQNGSERGVKLV